MNVYQDFLSPEEVAIITERKQPKRQIEQLNKQGIQFTKTARGNPIVRRDYANTQTKRPAQPKPKVEWTPNVLRR
ncbi:hypothetical protein A1D22_06045 [Pasteurellaceae bacterium LFhippo2]|nr:hypothetical protein [Pasteurellaceae bacterium LFhippo2]